MNRSVALIALALSFALVPPVPASASEDAPPTGATSQSLHETIANLDEVVFASFNHCAEPSELQRHAMYFANDVEFYHDTGGVTWTREAMLENTAKNVCGKIRRELVAGTLEYFRSRTMARSRRACTASVVSIPANARAWRTSWWCGASRTTSGR